MKKQNLSEVERDLREQMQRVDDAAYASQPKVVQLPTTETVDPVLHAGRLTSATVLQSYESGAKALENLSTELREMLKRNDEMVEEANASLKQIEETIAACIEQGKLFALRIKYSADMIKEVRDACTTLRSRIENPSEKPA